MVDHAEAGENSGGLRRFSQNWLVRDAALTLLIAFAFYLFGALTDAVETVAEFARAHEDLELDELLLAFVGACLGAFVFGLRRMRDQKREIQRRVKAEDEAAQLAFHDPLSGLPNRRLFEDRLNRAVERAKRHDESLAVLMVDLDRFKPINDLHGHNAGDRLLRAVTHRMRSVLRAQDTIARFGGDEFAVVETGMMQPQDAVRLARRLIGAMEEPFQLEGGRVTVGLSIGISVFPADAQESDQLVRRADVALCRAKDSGGSTFRFFETAMDAQLQERATLEHDLRIGILADEIEPYYQPIVDLAADRLVGFEALARWKHPQRGLMMPDSFIALAEDSGQIGALGEAVLRQACRDALTWPSHLSLSVNISPMQFRNASLAEDILDVLREEGFPPERLEIEITENAFIDDPGSAAVIVNKWKERGIKVALDDFGTGYSSLVHLRDLAFDKIKIDRSFIAKLGEDKDSAAIVRAVIALGKSLDVPTTAEGIELESHLEALNTEGCTLGQGFLFGKPVANSELRHFIEQHSSPCRACAVAGDD